MDVAAPPDALSLDLRALVVAADPVVRRALVSALRSTFERAELDARSSLVDVVEGASAVDVVLWDLGPDTLTVLDRFTSTTAPLVPVMALIPSAEHARDALAWGARAALPRDADDESLAAAVHAVLRGLTVLAPTFVEALLGAEEPVVAVAPTGEGITAREREVLGLVAEGLSNKLIAARLGISEHTVKFHVNAVMARLGAQSRTEAVVRAARRGLLVL